MAAAGIVFAANMTSTIVQPLYCHVADRFSKPWLLSVGLMLAGVGLALSGVVHSYRLIMVLAMVSGIGIAAYHPEAARLVNFSAGTKKGTAMSLFAVGGTIGYGIGPLVVTAALLQWGLNGTLVLMVPVTIMTIVMTSQFSTFESLGPSGNLGQSISGTEIFKEDWAAFARLTITVIGRSIIFYGLNTFIPSYWINGLNQSKAAGAMALTIFAGSGILGNLLGGSLADRLGQKKIMLLGFFGLMLFLPMLALAKSAGLDEFFPSQQTYKKSQSFLRNSRRGQITGQFHHSLLRILVQFSEYLFQCHYDFKNFYCVNLYWVKTPLCFNWTL